MVLSLAARVVCYGNLGHRTIAYLAQKYLTDDAVQYLDAILANNLGFDFSDAATWADTVRWARPYTKPWHYVGMGALWSSRDSRMANEGPCIQTRETRRQRLASSTILAIAKPKEKAVVL